MQAEELTRKYVYSEFLLFVAIKAIAKLCQKYRKEHGKGLLSSGFPLILSLSSIYRLDYFKSFRKTP